MAATLAGGIKRDVFYARARRFTTSLEAALAPNHIPPQVFHAVIRAFRDNLKTWHEITNAPVSRFGFAVAVHPKDPNTAWFVPAKKDETGSGACPTSGTYTFKVTGRHLAFTRIADAGCPPRGIVLAGSYTKLQ